MTYFRVATEQLSAAAAAFTQLDGAAAGLSRALSEAAFAYMACDLSAAGALGVRRQG